MENKHDRREYYRKWYQEKGRKWSADYYRKDNPKAGDFKPRGKAKGIECSVVGCDKECKSNGLCANHYQLMRVFGRTETIYRKRGSGHITSDGYLLRWVDGKFILDHRLVMQKNLGRELLETEHIHHLNGDRMDNRVENLQIVTNSEHHAIHHRDKRNTETHKACPKCNQVLLRSEFHKNKSRPDGCRIRCKTCTRKENNQWRKRMKGRVSISRQLSNLSCF